MLPQPAVLPPGMTAVNVGTIDVYVIDPSAGEWRVLVLQRGTGTRCPLSWETVHGHIEPGESTAQAARREVREETGLSIERLYVITVQPFFVQKTQAVELAVVFAAFVAGGQSVSLGAEHVRSEWLTAAEATNRLVWPRERAALAEIVELLRTGDAGPVEDVLRVL